MSTKSLLAGGLLTIALSLGTAAGAGAAGGHAHGEPRGGFELVLNNGQKWQTDAPLRQGMNAIREEVAAALPQIHGDTFLPAQYLALANGVTRQLDYIVGNCKLTPDADEQLHVVLVEVMDGVEAMKGQGDRAQGAARVVQALNAYPVYFDHPGWQPL